MRKLPTQTCNHFQVTDILQQKFVSFQGTLVGPHIFQQLDFVSIPSGIILVAITWNIVWVDSVIKIGDTIGILKIGFGETLLVDVHPTENLIFSAKIITGSASLSIVFSIIGVAEELLLYLRGTLTDFLRFAVL